MGASRRPGIAGRMERKQREGVSGWARRTGGREGKVKRKRGEGFNTQKPSGNREGRASLNLLTGGKECNIGVPGED